MSGDNRIESHYIPKKNETWIMEKSEDLRDDDQNEESEEDEGRERYDQEDKNRSVKTKLPGMVIPYLESDNGGIEIGY